MIFLLHSGLWQTAMDWGLAGSAIRPASALEMLERGANETYREAAHCGSDHNRHDLPPTPTDTVLLINLAIFFLWYFFCVEFWGEMWCCRQQPSPKRSIHGLFPLPQPSQSQLWGWRGMLCLFLCDLAYLEAMLHRLDANSIVTTETNVSRHKQCVPWVGDMGRETKLLLVYESYLWIIFTESYLWSHFHHSEPVNCKRGRFHSSQTERALPVADHCGEPQLPSAWEHAIQLWPRRHKQRS